MNEFVNGIQGTLYNQDKPMKGTKLFISNEVLH